MKLPVAKTGPESAVIEELDDSSVIDTAVDQLNGELSDPDQTASSTVEQMLAELDAELNRVEGDAEEVTNATETQEQIDADEPVAEEVVRTSVESATEAETAPQVTFRQGLMDKAKSVLGELNGPILQLLVAVLLLAALLFAWMMKRGGKSAASSDDKPDLATYAQATGKGVGVSYDVSENQLSLLEDDEDDDQWMQPQDVNIENIETLEGSDVDLITQSEVYLTYNRPMQAVQALMEEYSNTAMRNFIVTLNNDIEEFTNSEWDALRFDLDALRRQEQSSALDREESVDMNSFNPAEGELDKPSPELTLDESSIDLDFHSEDKTGS